MAFFVILFIVAAYWRSVLPESGISACKVWIFVYGKNEWSHKRKGEWNHHYLVLVMTGINRGVNTVKRNIEMVRTEPRRRSQESS